MISDDDLIAQASKHFTQHMEVTLAKWRPIEVNENYAVVEGTQWTVDDEDKQIRDEMPVITVNKIAPIIDAISGFEIQNRSEVSYSPRLTTEQAQGFNDVVDVGVKYIEDDSHASFENSQAFRDMLVCGVGAVYNRISYDNNVNGDVVVERVFPGFLMWDVSARKKNLADRNWNAVVRVVDAKALEEEGIEAAEAGVPGASVFFDGAEFLNYYSTAMRYSTLTIIIDYEWRVKEPVCRVKNPFFEYAQSELIMNYAQSVAERFKVNLDDGLLVFTKKDYSQFKKECEALGLPLEKETTQKRYKYYKCQFKGGKVYDKTENISQTGFSLKFMTGKYSEKDQCWYGILRAAKDVQRTLNKAISNYQGFLEVTPKGGVNIESDAVESLAEFLDTYAKAREVTIYKPNALIQGKVQPKTGATMPQGLADMIPLCIQLLMEVCGVTPDFMGINDSKEMTGKLQSQLVRQTLTTLATYFDAKKFFTIDQGQIFIDCLRILAETNPGRLIRDVVGDSGQKYLPLLLDNMAAEYDIVITDVPQTPTERQETFEKTLEMQGMLMNRPNPVDIMPMVLEYAPLKKEQVDKILQAMQPPPPPPPDPLQEDLLKSTAASQYAKADKDKADAIKTNMETLQAQQAMNGQPEADAKSMMELEVKRAEINLAEQNQAAQLRLQEHKQNMEERLSKMKIEAERKRQYEELRMKREISHIELAIKAYEAKKSSEPQEAKETPEEPDQNNELVIQLASSVEQMLAAMAKPKNIKVNVKRDANGNLQGEMMQVGA